MSDQQQCRLRQVIYQIGLSRCHHRPPSLRQYSAEHAISAAYRTPELKKPVTHIVILWKAEDGSDKILASLCFPNFLSFLPSFSHQRHANPTNLAHHPAD